MFVKCTEIEDYEIDDIRDVYFSPERAMQEGVLKLDDHDADHHHHHDHDHDHHHDDPLASHRSHKGAKEPKKLQKSLTMGKKKKPAVKK